MVNRALPAEAVAKVGMVLRLSELCYCKLIFLLLSVNEIVQKFGLFLFFEVCGTVYFKILLIQEVNESLIVYWTLNKLLFISSI